MPKSKINEGKYTQKLRPTEKQTCSPLSDSVAHSFSFSLLFRLLRAHRRREGKGWHLKCEFVHFLC